MTLINVGITGNTGFIGYHLTQHLQTFHKDTIRTVQFDATFFKNPVELQGFVKQCDVIVHLAAMNRGSDEEVYRTNTRLVKDLIDALESTGSTPRIIFASSTHEAKDTPYGISKRDGGRRFAEWAERNGAKATTLLIPNVFGPFGKPFYNSVVATFCYQLTHGQEPMVKEDTIIPLVSVQDVVKKIVHSILFPHHSLDALIIKPNSEIPVSYLLKRLKRYKSEYFDNHIVPELYSQFEIDLFNTFRSFIDQDHFPVYPEVHTDSRGYLAEIVKERCGGQVFFSTTKPGITRGDHYHLRKIERFCVIHGEAKIQIRKLGTRNVIEYYVTGTKPSFVDIPVYYIHNITNIGTEDMIGGFWTNELLDPNDPDAYYEQI